MPQQEATRDLDVNNADVIIVVVVDVGVRRRRRRPHDMPEFGEGVQGNGGEEFTCIISILCAM